MGRTLGEGSQAASERLPENEKSLNTKGVFAVRNPNTTDGSEVSDGELELELRMQERDRIAEEKRWRQIALLLHTEMKCIGLPP